MHIDLRRIEAKVSVHGQRLNGECLVQFEEVHIGEGPTRAGRNLAHGGNGGETEPLRLYAASGLGANHGERREAQGLCSLFAGDHQCCCAVAYAGGISCGD